MNTTVKPDRDQLERWLEESHVAYDLCGQCEGLHIRALQVLEGAVDSRLFLERYGVLLTTELEVRPMALFAISADLGRLNMDYPTLKLFLDVVDDATPQLVVAGVLPAGGGLTLQQFANFVAMTMEGTRQLAEECLQLDYLFQQGAAPQDKPTTSLH
jgi:hypothetical protein